MIESNGRPYPTYEEVKYTHALPDRRVLLKILSNGSVTAIEASGRRRPATVSEITEMRRQR